MNLNIEPVSEFIKQHDCKKISVGMGGADVYTVDDTYILKNVYRAFVDEDTWNSCCREAMCYSWFKKKGVSYVPKVIFFRITDNEIAILMKKYRMLEQNMITDRILQKIANILVSIHCSAIPDFLKTTKATPFIMDDKLIDQCKNQWQEVLSEHKNYFCSDTLTQISQNINDINNSCFTNKQAFIHGDFHCNNLLIEDSENLVVCDWQAATVGDPAGDISFFISRLGADGYQIDENKFISLYCNAYNDQVGTVLNENEIKCSMYLLELNTSFLFWHNYLHDAARERVARIYNKMTENFIWLSKY